MAPRFFSWFGELVRWYPKGMPAEEKRLVSKLDGLILVYAFLSYFTQFLDGSALTNAYVSGMREDLDLYGNRLNYINAAYYVGYVVFQIPSNMVLTKLPAQYYLPAAQVFFGAFTLGTAFVTTYTQLCVIRFFVGLFATSNFVGLLHIVNSWYKKNELGRRNALFWIACPIAAMCGGYFQAAAYTNLNNQNGLQGWRWLWIICGCITIPISLIGVFFFPDTPDRTKSRWLSTQEKNLARKRLLEDGFGTALGMSKAVVTKLLRNWRFYAYVMLLLFFCQMGYASGTPFILWLDSQPDKYSIPLVNDISTVTTAVTAVSTLVTSYYSDVRGNRYEVLIFTGVLCAFGNIVLAVWDVPVGLQFFAYIVNGWANGISPVIIAWTAEGIAKDPEARAITLAVYNTLGEVSALVVPLIAWKVTDAPKYRGGFIWATCICVAFLANIALVMYLERRAARLGQNQSEDEVTEVTVASEKDSTERNVDPTILKDLEATVIVPKL